MSKFIELMKSNKILTGTIIAAIVLAIIFGSWWQYLYLHLSVQDSIRHSYGPCMLMWLIMLPKPMVPVQRD